MVEKRALALYCNPPTAPYFVWNELAGAVVGVHLDRAYRLNNPQHCWPKRGTGYTKGPAPRTENTMIVFLYLEASQPSGSCYRLGIGCYVPPKLASMMAVFVRLF